VIRFFLKDGAAGNLIGVDTDERTITAAGATNRWCHFEVSTLLPPSSYASLAPWQRQAASLVTGSSLVAAYDWREFCYAPIPGSENAHFGFACIPEQYVTGRWSAHVEIRRWLPKLEPWVQTVIVSTKRAGSLADLPPDALGEEVCGGAHG
jgi:hypothetical protein